MDMMRRVTAETTEVVLRDSEKCIHMNVSEEHLHFSPILPTMFLSYSMNDCIINFQFGKYETHTINLIL